jgi:hypothetical protein
VSRHATPFGTVGLVCAFAFAVACSSSPGAASRTGGATDAGGDGGSTKRPGADGGAGTDATGTDASDAGESCSQGCTNTAHAGAICVVSADAQLVDTTGAPLADQTLLLCGTNLCSLPVKTDALGNAHFALCLNMTSPSLKFLGDTSYVSFAVRMTQPTETFPPITLVPLPAEGSPFPTGQGSVTSGSVTLEVAAGAVMFDATQPSDSSSHELRAAAVDPAKAPPGLDASLGVKALWGLAPANAILSPAATLTIPNPDPTDWPAGTQVDVVLNSLDESSTAPVPYGEWGTVGTATVSEDGTTIVTDSAAGDGLPLTGIVGVAPHQ